MKNSLIRSITLCLALSPVVAGAAELEDIDVSSVPNTFSNGSAANADEVNENFEYLRNNLDVLVELLKERKTITSDADRFTGNYVVTGMELTIDSCDGAPQVAHSSIIGTGVASGNEITITNTQSRWTLREGHLDSAVSHVDEDTLGDTFSLAFNADGTFVDVFGAMSADGNSFSLVNGETEMEDCSSAHVFYMSGVRTQ